MKTLMALILCCHMAASGCVVRRSVLIMLALIALFASGFAASNLMPENDEICVLSGTGGIYSTVDDSGVPMIVFRAVECGGTAWREWSFLSPQIQT